MEELSCRIIWNLDTKCFAISVSRLQTEKAVPTGRVRKDTGDCQLAGSAHFSVKRHQACYGKILLDQGEKLDKGVISFIENCLFTTLTNVNFDSEVHVKLLKEAQKIKDELRQQIGGVATENIYMSYRLPQEKSEMLRTAEVAGIMYDQDLDEDIRSLRQLIIYGLKGISAYGHQARELGYFSDAVDDFYVEALSAVTDDNMTVEELIRLSMKAGEMALAVMKTLDEANTQTYGNPTPHAVSTTLKAGPFIIVSGHDFHDLEMLLQQSAGTGVNIYTHGEMLPGHGYEGLKKYPHLIGNFGGAWQDQQKQFDNLPGCILMTTNCLMRPRESYKDRIYSTNVVGWDGVKYIGKMQTARKISVRSSVRRWNWAAIPKIRM